MKNYWISLVTMNNLFQCLEFLRSRTTLNESLRHFWWKKWEKNFPIVSRWQEKTGIKLSCLNQNEILENVPVIIGYRTKRKEKDSSNWISIICQCFTSSSSYSFFNLSYFQWKKIDVSKKKEKFKSFFKSEKRLVAEKEASIQVLI